MPAIPTTEKPSTLHIPDEDEDTELKREQIELKDETNHVQSSVIGNSGIGQPLAHRRSSRRRHNDINPGFAWTFKVTWAVAVVAAFITVYNFGYYNGMENGSTQSDDLRLKTKWHCQNQPFLDITRISKYQAEIRQLKDGCEKSNRKCNAKWKALHNNIVTLEESYTKQLTELKKEHAKQLTKETEEHGKHLTKQKDVYGKWETGQKEEFRKRETTLKEECMKREIDLKEEHGKRERDLKEEFGKRERDLKEEFGKRERNLKEEYGKRERDLKEIYGKRETDLKEEFGKQETDLKGKCWKRETDQKEECEKWERYTKEKHQKWETHLKEECGKQEEDLKKLIKELRNENRLCKCQEKTAVQPWMADSTSEMTVSKVETQETDFVITDGPAASAEGAKANKGNIRDVPQGKRLTHCFINKTWCHVDKSWTQVKKLGSVGKETIVNSFKKIKTSLLKYMEC